MRLIGYIALIAVGATVAAEQMAKHVPEQGAREAVQRPGAAIPPKPAATPGRERATGNSEPARDQASFGQGCYPGEAVSYNADRGGHFTIGVEINGRTEPMLVDTGASTVSLPYEAAVRLGLNLVTGRKGLAHTANGQVENIYTRAPSLKVGPICLYNVDVAVAPPGALSVGLLGMNVIGKMKRFEMSNSRLVMAN